MRFKTSISLSERGRKAVELLRCNNINISRFIETLILNVVKEEKKEVQEDE